MSSLTIKDELEHDEARRLALSPANRRLTLIICAVILAAVSIFGNQYRYYQYNSGRYLVLPLKTIDPELFPNDPVVESLSRYHSLFYEGLGNGLRIVNASPASLPPVVDALYVLSKIAMTLAMILLARRLSDSLWLSIVLAAWACHLKSPFIGGVSLNMPTLTHLEVVYVMALFALIALFSGRRLLFWALLSAAIFIHSLAAFQFALCTAPLFLYKRPEREHWLGAAIFALCCLIYFLTMAPPSLSSEEGRIFVEAERLSSHINLFKYKPFHWSGALGMLAVGGLGWRAFNREDEKSALLLKFALTGTIAAIVVSFLAVRTGSVSLSLFQPLRLFYWVGLFCSLSLAAATVQTFRSSIAGGIMLSAPLALVAIDSRWSVVLISLAIIYLALREALSRWAPARLDLLEQASRWMLAALSALFFGAWAMGERSGFASLRQPDLVPLAAIGLLTTVVFYKRRAWGPLAAALTIVACLGVASVQSRRFFEERADPAWDEVRRWCHDHTEKDARFLTPPDKPNFRTLSLRSSQTERITQLSWVDPFVYQQNARDAERVENLIGKGDGDLKALISLAKEFHCQYLVTQDPLPGDVIPRFRVGTYSIVEVE
jgi:hypothetical protein